MVIRTTFSRGDIGPSLKGLYYSYSSAKGEITSSWPQKRGRKSNDLDKFNRDMFRQAAKATKEMAPEIIAYHAENAKGTPMLPRDALTAALYGRGPVIFKPDGSRIVPLAARIDMSMMMDNLAWQAGSLMWRGPSVWEPIPPPDTYSMLVYDTELGPRWIDAGDFASAPVWLMPIGTTLTSHNSPCKGNKWYFWRDTVISAVMARHTIGAGVTFNWSIYRVTSTGTILEIILDIPNIYVATGGDQMNVLELPSPLTLLAGEQYIIAIRAPGLGDTYNVGVRNGGLVPPQLGCLPDEARYWCTKSNPAIGDSFTFDSATQLYMVGWQGV